MRKNGYKIEILILFFALLCTACGREEPDIEPEFLPIIGHYLRFAPDSGKFDTITSIKYGVMKPGRMGLCHKNDARTVLGKQVEPTTRTITIAYHESKALLAVTLFHELGHCVHGKDHSEGEFDIMNPDRSTDVDYWTQENIDQALVELFAPG